MVANAVPKPLKVRFFPKVGNQAHLVPILWFRPARRYLTNNDNFLFFVISEAWFFPTGGEVDLGLGHKGGFWQS